jgi:hypothetical protein
MPVLPWRQHELQCDRPFGEVMRLLQRAIPPRRRVPRLDDAPGYFCGEVNTTTGRFQLVRNVHWKGRAVFPVLNGMVLRRPAGARLDISVRPSVSFWLLLLPALSFLLFIPIGLLAWWGGPERDPGSLILFIVIPLGGVVFSSWLWVPALIVHYIGIKQYPLELNKLLDRMNSRTADGLSVLEAPEPPAQREQRVLRHRQTSWNRIRAAVVCLAVLGVMLLGVGLQGIVRQEITMSGRSRPGAGHNRDRVTLRGEEAVTTGVSLAAAGAAAAIAGLLGWRVTARRLDGKPRMLLDMTVWTPWERAALIVAFLLLIGSVGSGIWAVL